MVKRILNVLQEVDDVKIADGLVLLNPRCFFKSFLLLLVWNKGICNRSIFFPPYRDYVVLKRNGAIGLSFWVHICTRDRNS